MSSKSLRRFFHLIDSAKLHARLAGGGFYKFLSRCRGAEFLGSAEFLGRPKIKLYPGTRLIIGNNCRFQSGHTDNPLGNHHPCMIFLYNKGTVVTIGDNCGFSAVTIGAHVGITLGNNVRCGANVTITDSDWHPEDPRVGKNRPVVIGDNVWLGASSIVLKGTRIGRNTLIGAGSIVTGEIPANVIAAGNPCKVIRPLTEEVIRLLETVGPNGMIKP